ncbi:hypothetical protein [Aquimarina sediminis]|uniref:hypothetical protein n=1 Tax=Aquimarina sediminis TaxID=2070536 RepID=UPI000CA024AD|nr:hypothetical protein [Aquimarina sediminis]
MSQFQDLLNALIKSKLSDINSAVTSAIKSRGLDPMIHVASGSDKIGSIDLGICTAEAVASYALQNLTGLSSLHINSLVITSATTSEDGKTLHGAVKLEAVVTSNLGIHVGGKFKAGCGFLKPSVGIGGNVTISKVSINATGDFDATVGEKLCLTEIDVKNPGLNYGNINVDIDGLGIFNSLLHPLENFILGLVKGSVINTIEGAVTPAINNALDGVLPQCTSL